MNLEELQIHMKILMRILLVVCEFSLRMGPNWSDDKPNYLSCPTHKSE